MRIGIMQPYFFPYIGYWQLIKATDEFILFDEVQYIRHGWINRNRILNTNEGWSYIIVPLKKHSRNDIIRDIKISENIDWKNILLNPISNYKKTAPFYSETFNLIENTIKKLDNKSIVEVNRIIILELCDYLGINTKISISSHQNFNYLNVHDAGDWALEISKQKKAKIYLNPISGKEIFDKEKFISNNINILFLKPHEIIYNQKKNSFEPWLSIIDVLMFNGKDGTADILNYYDIMEG